MPHQLCLTPWHTGAEAKFARRQTKKHDETNAGCCGTCTQTSKFLGDCDTPLFECAAQLCGASTNGARVRVSFTLTAQTLEVAGLSVWGPPCVARQEHRMACTCVHLHDDTQRTCNADEMIPFNEVTFGDLLLRWVRTVMHSFVLEGSCPQLSVGGHSFA